MSFFESFRIALAMLRLHKLRAFLTMLGVIIGVMSVSVIVLVVNGFQSFIESEFDSLDARAMFLFVDTSRLPDGVTTTIDRLTEDDRAYILDRTNSIQYITAFGLQQGQDVRYRDREARDVTAIPVDQYAKFFSGGTILSGRDIEAADVLERRNVCVVSEAVVDLLFPNGSDPIGSVVSLPGITLEIIGVAENEEGAFGDNNPRALYAPITTAQDKWLGGEDYFAFQLKPYPDVDVNDAMDEVWRVLMVKSDNQPVYRLDSSEAILGVFTGVIGAIGGILGAVAALSLLVGGIGIMNIMLVSVTERTREIGLRKAVGAKRGAILSQFLVEAAVLSLVGGLIGMGLAYGLGQIVTVLTAANDWPNENGLAAPFPIAAAVGAALFSAAIGVVFGFFPAVRASALDPIEALRFE